VRNLLIVAVLAVTPLFVGPGVAGACACGAVLADERLEAVQETALVEVAGGTQAITLNIATETEATEAAFIMPVPARAEFTLADGALFTELDEISAPRVEYREVERDGDGAGGAPSGSDVTVTDHVAVGPYDVAQLTGVDSGAVAGWLTTNGFELPPALAGALTPYLAEGWLVVAVRLTPEGSGTFDGGLPPMRFTFPTTEPVYPMRLSATARYSQPLRLYVLADHRMDISNPAPEGIDPELTFAGWVEPDPAAYPVVAGLVTERRFLTRYDASFLPEYLTDDIHLTRASADDAYRAVVVETRYVSGSLFGQVAWWVLGILAALGLALWLFASMHGRRRSLRSTR
jgi:hypothetical protein